MFIAAAARFVCHRRKIPSGIVITYPEMVPFLVTYATRLPTFLQPERFRDDAGECELSCESFNEWGTGRCWILTPVSGGGGTKISPPKDIFDQPTCERISIQSKFADHVGYHVVVLSPGRAVLVHPRGRNRRLPLPPIVERFIMRSVVRCDRLFI